MRILRLEHPKTVRILLYSMTTSLAISTKVTIMLHRAAYQDLMDWKRNKTNECLLVCGARQVGKTTLIREFGHRNYTSMAEINFLNNRAAIDAVSHATDADDLLFRISVLARTQLVPGESLIFLDEVQACGDLITWMKFLSEASDYDFVLSGSLLGLDAFNIRSVPVGFLQTVTMYPMGFDEFCLASGLPDTALSKVRDSFQTCEPVPDFLHTQLMDLFYKYLLIGGMPAAVQAFVDNPDMQRVRATHRNLFTAYEADMSQYVEDKVESRQIKMVYEAIPGQLNAENKRFKYTRLSKHARFANMETSFDWLAHAGIALPVSKVTAVDYPLGLNENRNQFKLFMNDVGLLTSRLMGNVDLDILNRKDAINFGSIYENVAAQELAQRGFELHYYNTAKIGEVDFVVKTDAGGIILCEIKSGKDYHRHSALDNLLATGPDNVTPYVFCNDNVHVDGGITYLPIYMLVCLSPAGM